MSQTPQPGPSSESVLSRNAGEAVLVSAQRALECLVQEWDSATVGAWVALVLSRKGRVVVSGMGKSGLIGQKIAATLASTGCPSLFLHPAEALHGDLGMVTDNDSVLLLSNSGETEEIIKLLPSLIRLGVPIASITSTRDSRLGQASAFCFTYRLVAGEGCPLNFAPMASTTLQLVWGDILAATVMTQSGFTLEHFASLHPAGNLGARLMCVRDLMHADPPRIQPETPILDALTAMSQGRLGMTLVLDRDQRLAGVISDGDIRRAIERSDGHGINPLELCARDIMTPNPIRIPEGMLALEAARLMESRKITFLVVDRADQETGVLHIHDLLAAKVI